MPAFENASLVRYFVSLPVIALCLFVVFLSVFFVLELQVSYEYLN